MERGFIAVYILASRRNGTLYIGVTNTLPRRVHQHKHGLVAGFTQTYGCKLLAWYEPHATMVTAIQREKSLKRWRRKWKLDLIEARRIQIGGICPTAGTTRRPMQSPLILGRSSEAAAARLRWLGPRVSGRCALG